jgi:hypothetical protein
MQWASYVPYKRKKCTQSFATKNMKEIDCMEDIGIGGKIILKWILNK